MHELEETDRRTCNEPAILLVTRRLAEFFKVLSNPCRVLILEELRRGESDVQSLTESLKVSQSTISQQMAVLKSHKLVDERRAGRTVFYSLRNPELALWIGHGLKFTGPASEDATVFLTAVEHAKFAWQNGSKSIEDGVREASEEVSNERDIY